MGLEFTFADGFLVVLIIQSFILGGFLFADVTLPNKILGSFIIIYAINCSRIVLYKLDDGGLFMALIIYTDWAYFYFPLLYLYWKSHVSKLSFKQWKTHLALPSILCLNSVLQIILPDSIISMDSTSKIVVLYSCLLVFSILYTYRINQEYWYDEKWNSVIRGVKNKVYVFIMVVYVYLFLISIRLLNIYVFGIAATPEDPTRQVQKFIFFVVFFLMPIYAYTVLNRFKRFIQPRTLVADSIGKAPEIQSKLMKLFDEEKVFRDKDFNQNRLAKLLDTPINDLRIYIQNTHNLTITEFINNYRVEEFIHQMSMDPDNLYNIEGLALSSGFKSRSTFYRVFKNTHNCTPKEYFERS